MYMYMYVPVITNISTVEPPIADSPRSGSPLYSGQNTIPRMNLPYNTRTSNLRKAATSEFSRTDNRGNPIQPRATQNYLHERTDDHTPELACMIVVIIIVLVIKLVQ